MIYPSQIEEEALPLTWAAMQVGANQGSIICAQIAERLHQELEIRLGRASRPISEESLGVDFAGVGAEDLEEAIIRLLAAQETWRQTRQPNAEKFCTEILALIAHAKPVATGNA